MIKIGITFIDVLKKAQLNYNQLYFADLVTKLILTSEYNYCVVLNGLAVIVKVTVKVSILDHADLYIFYTFQNKTDMQLEQNYVPVRQNML